MQYLHAISLVVPDYDAAIAFYCDTLGWQLVEDVDLGDKRWVRIQPPSTTPGTTSDHKQASLILARAEGDQQQAAIGNQFGGRVGLFLATDNFVRDHEAMQRAGVAFEETPRHEPYGTVAVWCDPFGNRWDLIQFT